VADAAALRTDDSASALGMSTTDPLQPTLFEARAPAPEPIGRRHNILVGTCSWTDPSLIKSKAFYPRGCGSSEQRLAYYASQFPLVEVDSSFFAMPDPAIAQLWAARTPPGFAFNVKAFRLFTGHQTPPQVFPPDIQPLLPPLAAGKKNYYYADVPEPIRDELWRRFLAALAPLQRAGKLRAAHFQFAPWVTSARPWREHVELCVERMAGQLLAVEFRNETWFGDGRAERTLDWERELGVAHVIVDEPQGVGNYAHGVWEVTEPRLAVVRLHGRNERTWNAKGLRASSERFDYEYGDAEIEELAGKVSTLVDRAFELHVLVNVNFEDQGVRAARRLVERLRQVA
jgi:uncharacterized protein YecE (DUF72 family)